MYWLVIQTAKSIRVYENVKNGNYAVVADFVFGSDEDVDAGVKDALELWFQK